MISKVSLMFIKNVSKGLKQIIKSQLVINIIIAFFINFIMEICGRKSVEASLAYLTDQTDVFLYNMALIFLSLCFVFIIKRLMYLI